MALLPLSSTSASASASAALPHIRPCPPAALHLRLPSHSLNARARAVSTGYAASFYGGSAMSAAGGADEEEVGDESGFGPGLGLGGGGLGMSAAEAALALEEREMPPCPPGLRQYETMVVLRPDMSEEERLAFIQRYEEVIVLPPLHSRISKHTKWV
jgi:small subunit ribosomal protein S6